MPRVHSSSSRKERPSGGPSSSFSSPRLRMRRLSLSSGSRWDLGPGKRLQVRARSRSQPLLRSSYHSRFGFGPGMGQIPAGDTNSTQAPPRPQVPCGRYATMPVVKFALW